MKIKFIVAVACICVGQLSSAQKSTEKIIFLDSLGFVTTEGNHTSYRTVEDFDSTKKVYLMKEYYKSGKLLMEGASLTDNGYRETGIINHYYESGNKKSVTTYSDGVPLGTFTSWYDNGSNKEQGEYLKSTNSEKRVGFLKIKSYWNLDNKQAVIDGNGVYEETNRKYSASGPVKDGLKDGVWTGKDEEIKYIFTESYSAGKLISGISTDSGKIQHSYSETEIKPEFKGGITAFYKYIARNFRSPEQEGVKGKVFMTFFIDPDGKVSDVRVIQDVGYGSGEEGLRVMNASPDWNPGLTRGIPVRTRYSLPITIQSAY